MELHFRSKEDAWDPTVPGRFQEVIRAEYPGKPRQVQLVQHSVTFNGGQAAGQQTLQFGKVQFPTQDEKRMVALGNNVLSVHILRPYSAWTDFLPRIERALAAYVGVMSPLNVARIGVRYINLIQPPVPPHTLSTYFTRAVDPQLPGTLHQFFHSDTFRLSDGVHWQLTFAAEPQTGSALGPIVLDIDLIDTNTYELGDVIAHVDELRNYERTIFEGLITDELRKVFDADGAD